MDPDQDGDMEGLVDASFVNTPIVLQCSSLISFLSQVVVVWRS